MKNTFLLLVLLILVGCSHTMSQVFQLPNSGFELWDGLNADDEPSNWNGFPSAACDLSGMYAVGCNSATATRHARSTDVRPGSLGNYSCRIYATQITILGNTIIANGALTTGQIRVGSTTAASNQNYNITRTGQPDFRCSFTGKPDSISFWARFVCPSQTQEAKMIATIHGNYDYREPEGSDPNAAAHVVATAAHYFTRGNQNWKKYTVPFDYNFPANTPAYILVTFTTNKDAGLGSANDMLFIDDIEMIYNPRLSQLAVNGVNIQNFHPDTDVYDVTVPCHSIPQVSAVAASQNASVQIIQATTANNSATITVTTGNVSKQYVVNFLYQNITNYSVNVCLGEAYSDNWFNLSPQLSAGTFHHSHTTYTSPLCDSVIVLTLHVHPVYTADTFHVMICNNSSYDFFGTPLTVPGVYDTILPTVNGCDSLVNISLTIGSYYLLTFNAVICEGETYSLNGFNQSVGGSDTLYFVAANGCDSLVALNLNVLPVHHTYIVDSVVQGEAYHKNGFIIMDTETEGIVKDTLWLLNNNGCDSTVYLTLHIVSELFEESDDNNFSCFIYPNPATNLLNIEIESPAFAIYLVQFFDTYGRMHLVHEMFNKKATIDVRNLPAGLFTIRILSSANVAKHTRFVKY